MNLNQVTLPATDLAESAAFYRGMGFLQIVDTEHYARFECPQGEATFSLHRVDGPPRSSDVIVYFESDRLDDWVAELQDEGYEFISAPADRRWLWREARLYDPAGNLLCLYHAGENRKHPPWRVERRDGRRETESGGR